MEIYLVRHTHVAIGKGICYGHADVPVSPDFSEEAGEVLKQLRHLKDPVVYSSPLKRCSLLAEKLSTQIKYDARLEELNFGKWELKPWTEIKGPEAERWMKDFVNTKCPGGESYIDLNNRVKSFMKDLLDKSHQTAIVITHGGVIRTVLAIIQNIPLEKSFSIEVNYGQVFPLSILDKTSFSEKKQD